MFKNVGIAGDWHANLSWAQNRLTDFYNMEISTILHLGDFGVWPGNSGNKYLDNINLTLKNYKQKIYVTPGNHEDYDQIKNMMHIKIGSNKGWMIQPERPNILYAPRGHRWTWGEKTFVSLGGGNSIDRDYPHRVEGKTWWADEQIKPYEAKKVAKDGYADIFIAHDAPSQVPLQGGHKAGTAGKWSAEDRKYAEKSRKMLQIAINGVKPKLFLYGHYHMFFDDTIAFKSSTGNYNTRVVGLNKDGELDNIAYLELENLNLEMIDYDHNPHWL